MGVVLTMKNILQSPIFYMGSKYKLLKYLIPLFPTCETFVDLFGGSGVVCMNFKGTKKTIYNENNPNIVNLVNMFKNNSVKDLDEYFNEKIKKFNLVVRRGRDYKENSESGKGYYDFRDYYNDSKEKDCRDLYLLSCYSINHLMRFNKQNNFNASVGVNRYIKQKIIDGHVLFQGIDVINGNAFDFDFDSLTHNDFVYLDPPYLNTNAVYNEKRAFGGWDIDCDYELFNILEKLNTKQIKWGLSNVFQNRGKTNNHLIDWCVKNNWKVYHLKRNYNPFSRGNSNNDEVYICNYDLDEIE